MAWYHEYDGGRSYYTEFGHTEESYTDAAYLKHVLGGIQYAIGKNQELDYSKAHSERVPEEDRFSKNIIATGFEEPTEMAILPNLDIIVVQRKGEVLFFDGKSGKLSEAGKLNVYHKASVPRVNAEEGLLGLAADPEYAKNNYIYLYYSPVDTSVNRLSRFVFKDGKLDMASEKKVLDVYSQRQICCHTGGSIAFGPDGLLYLSTGDNSTPFDQPGSYSNHGFAPLDQRPGFEQFDARRSAGNANDLRGKILRIKIQPDGSYTIPEGNLFKAGLAGTRPEIYVMGNRNPYRISVDRKNSNLYWGEVGPDASNDSMETRGPRGYDELNQARKAGFFGWPLFVGNNYPYREYDYGSGVSGPLFDPQKPLNNSRNNTGINELPPVSPTFIYYPYAVSREFPELGTGGRNAMAGPVYYADLYPSETRFPEYFNGKLFFYDWIRGWIKIVTMDKEGNYEKMESFMPNTKLNSAIDMEMGPDGRLYILEYGTGWFTKNADAALSRVEYNGGNRAPKVQLEVSKTSGSLPFTIKASAAGTRDPDKDPIIYTWHFGNNPVIETKTPEAEFTFKSPGENEVYVEVKDDKGAVTRSKSIPVYAGNEMPQLKILLDPQPSFYFPGKPVNYRLSISDFEDGSTEKGGIDPAGIFVKVDYLSGQDKAQVVGHQGVNAFAEGKNLVASLDCRTCHKEAEKSVGPAYELVAAKYAKDPSARTYLVNKIIKGGGGVWGETAMSAHPDLKEGDAGKIADWILSLAKGNTVPSLPQAGEIRATDKDASDGKNMQITASYTDKGASGAKPMTGFATIQIRNPALSVSEKDSSGNFTFGEFGSTKFASLSAESGWLMFDNINLQFVTGVEINYGMREPFKKGYIIEFYADRPGATKLGETRIGPGGKLGRNSQNAALQNTGDHPRKLYLLVRKADPSETSSIIITSLRFLAK